jgi:chaperonin GroES
MLRPLGDRILIRPEDRPTETESGLHLVEHHRPDVMGTVARVPDRIARDCAECGHTMWSAPIVSVGDTVIFSYSAGQDITVDDERFILLRESDIHAVLEGVTDVG